MRTILQQIDDEKIQVLASNALRQVMYYIYDKKEITKLIDLVLPIFKTNDIKHEYQLTSMAIRVLLYIVQQLKGSDKIQIGSLTIIVNKSFHNYEFISRISIYIKETF